MKKKYLIPETECLETHLEMNFLATGNGSGENATTSNVSGDFDDFFN